MEKIIEGVQKKYIIYCLLSVSITFIGLFLWDIELIPKYYTIYTGLVSLVLFVILSIDTYVSKKVKLHTEKKRLIEEKNKINDRKLKGFIKAVDYLNPIQYSIFILTLISSSNKTLKVTYGQIKGCGLSKYLDTDIGMTQSRNYPDVCYDNQELEIQDLQDINLKLNDFYFAYLVNNLSNNNKLSNFDMEKCKSLIRESELFTIPVTKIFGEQGRKWSEEVIKEHKK